MAIRFSARKFSTSGLNPLRVCVVGSGPSGFYTAEKLLKAHAGAEVDIIDRLPTPFGLVRSGVAPDHQETKFEIYVNRLLSISFRGLRSMSAALSLENLCLGTSISLHELREMYHVVVLSFGAESDRILGIPGEDLQGVYAAREFVWWYNGHPDCRKLAPDLKNTDSAVILGQGNVALDIARILLRPTSELSTTDIASHALGALEESSISYLPQNNYCIFNAMHLSYLSPRIKNLHVNIQKDDLCVTPTDEVEMKNSRIHRRILSCFPKQLCQELRVMLQVSKSSTLYSLGNQTAFLISDDKKGHVTSLKFEKTMLNRFVLQNGTKEHRLQISSVDGLPFDHRKGIVPNVKGRVLGNSQDGSQHPQPGLYVCGWLKRGPTGIIGTNLYCAERDGKCLFHYIGNLANIHLYCLNANNTVIVTEKFACIPKVASISEDLEQGSLSSSLKLPKPGREGLSQLLDSRNVRIVPFSGWEKIDAEERRLGSLKNKPREKLASWEELLKVATTNNISDSLNGTFRVILSLCREASLLMRVPWSCGRWWICLSDTVMYNVVIKLFFEAGRVDEVEKLVEEMESVVFCPI
ncbi:unnamed protein product [Rhodiola kirilowii]